MFLFSLPMGWWRVQHIAENVINNEIFALQVTNGSCMFDLSALTGMNKSQYVILKMQLGEWMQVIWKTERSTGYLYSVYVFVKTLKTHSTVSSK